MGYSSDKKFAIVIPSYNNESYAHKNVTSCLDQKYENFHVYYINDISTDKTLSIVKQIKKNHPKGNKLTIIDNKIKKLALRNFYDTIHKYVDDSAIVVTVDGDDWLAHKDVLRYLNYIYSKDDVWVSYGQYAVINSEGKLTKGHCKPLHRRTIFNNSFRSLPYFNFSHIRVYYAWLFKKIRKKDFLDIDGKFFRTAADLAIMYPLLEMAGNHVKFISEILYIYNDMNPINDHKVNREDQYRVERLIKKAHRYTPLKN